MDSKAAFSTYFGGTREDVITDIALNGEGDAYVVGYTESPGLATNAAADADCDSGVLPCRGDAFLAKLSPSGATVFFSYLGSDGFDRAESVAFGPDGSVFVAGTTHWAEDFPYTSWSNISAPGAHAFVARFSADGSNVHHSAVLGGADDTEGADIAVDDLGRAFITGRTLANDLPIVGGFDSCRDSCDASAMFDYYDGFIARFDPALVGAISLGYSSYLGGAVDDRATSIAVDGGDAYVTGETLSGDFPMKHGFQESSGWGIGGGDAFLTRVNTDIAGSGSLTYATSLGGDYQERGTAVTLGGNGEAYVVGTAASPDLSTSNAYQADMSSRDAFVLKVDTTLVGAASRRYVTYVGGEDQDVAQDVDLVSPGVIAVSGWTSSASFPVVEPYQRYLADVEDFHSDGFLFELDTNLSGVAAMRRSTYLGGSRIDEGYGVAAAGGSIYVAGETTSMDFPLTSASRTSPESRCDPPSSNDCDGFVAKFPADTTNIVPPETALLVTPRDFDNGESMRFEARVFESIDRFECKLDDQPAFTTCGSVVEYPDLADGPHTFQIRSVDADGLTDDTPASRSWIVDRTAPDTRFVTVPSSPRNRSSSVQFEFTSDEEWTSFQCSFNDSTFERCSSPYVVDSSDERVNDWNALRVRATDLSGNVEPVVAQAGYFLDLVVPDTTITAPPPSRKSPESATVLEFTSTEDSVSFSCKVNGAPYESCSSPLTVDPSLEKLDAGNTVSVRARDSAGNVDATPASVSYFIDATAPETMLDSQPTREDRSSSATFAFSSNESGSTFWCSLDGGNFEPCESPHYVEGLQPGPHTFEVKAEDRVNHIDESPEAAEWNVRTVRLKRVRHTPKRGSSEYAVVTNLGEVPVALRRWALSNRRGDTYLFPKMFVLSAGARVKIHTGRGRNDADDLYQRLSRSMWGRSDRASLIDSSATVVQRCRWTKSNSRIAHCP